MRSRFGTGLFVGAIVGTVASVACSDAATDMMGHVMRDAGGALVDAGLGLMDAGGEVRDASETMVDAARAEGLTVREITCDRTATVRTVAPTSTYVTETFYALVSKPGIGRATGARAEIIQCDNEITRTPSTGAACAEGSTCTDDSPDLSGFCSRWGASRSDNQIYVSCGYTTSTTYPPGTSPSFVSTSYSQRYRHVYLVTDD
jgi:hypothetical protein